MHFKMPRLSKIGAFLVFLVSAEACILALAGIALLVLVGIGVYTFVPLSQPGPTAVRLAAAQGAQSPLGTALSPIGSAQPPQETSTLTPTATQAQPTQTPSPTQTVTPSPSATPSPTPTQSPSPLPSDTPTATSTRKPKPTPTETPVPATPTPPYDFIVAHQRLRTNEENGGTSPGGSVSGCGYGHEIYVWVIDKAGAPLDGMVIGDTYDNPKHISGEKGPGHAQYILYMNGYRLLVLEDNNAGRPVTSQVSEVMSGNDWEIPIPWLIQGHYCATEDECLARRADPNKPGGSGLCWGHYSYEIIFQRTW